MRRFVMAGVFLELALLIVGLTWISPNLLRSNDNQATGQRQATAGQAAYRTCGNGSGAVIDVSLTAEEHVQTIGDGVKFDAWTFNGTAPGSVIRVTQGDTVHFTLTNDSKLGVSHSIDFHAAQTPWDKNYQPVAPGQSFSFDWIARFPGVFMYHCSVPPVLMHIANGMYGAIVVEPSTPLPPAREYVLVSSEFYPGAKKVNGVYEGDMDAMAAGDPTYVEWNGGFNRYQTDPLVARPNELIRIWVLDAGPTLTTAFHVIGALFDHVYPDGNPTNVLNGIQTYNVPPGGGAMFEMRISDAGLYPFVTHSFAYTGLGAVGVIKIDPNAPPAPATYPTMGDAFSAGVKPATPAAAGPAGRTSTGPAPGGSAPGGQPATGTGGAASSISVDASITSGFSPKDITVKEGKVTVTLANQDPMIHNFTIDALGVAIGVDASGTATGSFDAKPGVYEFYCSIPGHKQAGMAGTLTVLPTVAH